MLHLACRRNWLMSNPVSRATLLFSHFEGNVRSPVSCIFFASNNLKGPTYTGVMGPTYPGVMGPTRDLVE